LQETSSETLSQHFCLPLSNNEALSSSKEKCGWENYLYSIVPISQSELTIE